MMVAHCHVATVPPLFQTAHATVHVIDPCGLELRGRFSATSCSIPTKEEETVNVWPQEVRVFSACDSTWSVFLVPILCLPGETAVVCNVNEALPGCVNGFNLMLLFYWVLRSSMSLFRSCGAFFWYVGVWCSGRGGDWVQRQECECFNEMLT